VYTLVAIKSSFWNWCACNERHNARNYARKCNEHVKDMQQMKLA